jgi:DNA-binding NarL/FixJ family response regulator
MNHGLSKTQSSPIRLIIADDHELLREGLKALLSLEADFQIVGEVSRADELESLLKSTPCDILILDLKMDRSVLDDVAELSQLTKVLVLTGSERVADAFNALRAGARAIVQKKFAVKNLVEAIRTVATGAVWLPPTLQALLAKQLNVPPSEHLTERECEIVNSVAIGLKNAEIGRKLAISEFTVKTHLTNIFQKLDVRDRVGLTLYALRTGMVSLPEDYR